MVKVNITLRFIIRRNKLTTERDVVEVLGRLDGLDFAANVEFLYSAAKVCDRGMCWVVSTEDLDGFLYLVRAVHILNWNKSAKCSPWRCSDIPVIIAKASSSRGSRRAIRAPGAIDLLSMSACETSRVIGMDHNVPSARRR